MSSVSVEATIASVQALMSRAQQLLHIVYMKGQFDHDDPYPEVSMRWAVDEAFTQLLILTESLGLRQAYKQIRQSYDSAKEEKEGLSAWSNDPDGNPYLHVQFDLRRFVSSIEAVYGLKSPQVVSKDVIEVLRATLYAITDANCFSGPPENESDVHNRIEAVMRCIFPDLQHKPPIPKSVKNFEPDTGLPSIRTLVEYKFIESKNDVRRVADEILADTRGYKSSDWDKFVFLIYETYRLKTEREWNDLLQQCGTALNTQVIVICGEPRKLRAALKRKVAARRAGR